MPNNIKILKQEFKKRLKSADKTTERTTTLAETQQTVATLLLVNLMKYTNVDTGRLAGGWTVRLRGKSGGDKRSAKNKTRQPSAKNLVRIDKITGKTTVRLVNSVPYGRYVNDGTRKQVASNFVELALIATRAQLKRLGLTIKVKGTL